MSIVPVGGVAGAVGVLIGAGPVVRLAGRWTPIDRWWRCWCALTCGLWTGGSAGVAMHAGADPVVAVGIAAVMAAVATTLSVIDVRERRLPHVLTAAVGSAALALGIAVGDGRVAAIGAMAAYAIHLVLRLLTAGAVGGGDVQLAVAVGAVAGPTGPLGWATVFVLAAGATAVLCAGVRGARVPHGPSLCAAAIVVPVLS